MKNKTKNKPITPPTKLSKNGMATITHIVSPSGNTLLTIGELTLAQLRLLVYELLQLEKFTDKGIIRAIAILNKIAP